MLTDQQRTKAYYKLKKYMNEMIDCGIIGFFLNTFLKWILRIGAFAIYFVPQPTLEEELSGMGDILMGWWIVWGLLSIWSLTKKLKSA